MDKRASEQAVKSFILYLSLNTLEDTDPIEDCSRLVPRFRA